MLLLLVVVVVVEVVGNKFGIQHKRLLMNETDVRLRKLKYEHIT